MSAFGGKADVNHSQAKGLLLAISGPKDVSWKSEIFQNRVYGTPPETANSPSGILRDRNWREGCTEISAFPYPAKKHVAALFFGLVALGGALEAIQTIVPGREAGVADAVANAVGTGIGLFVERAVRKSV